MTRVAIGLVAAALVACAGSSGTSAVEGTLQSGSFSSAPQALTATNEAGETVAFALGTAGNFAGSLASGHSWALQVTLATGEKVPVAFPRVGGALDGTFLLDTSDAVVALGTVRAVGAMPHDGITVSVEGLTQAIGCAACTVDTGVTTCHPGHEQHSGGCMGMSGPIEHHASPMDSAAGSPRPVDPSRAFAFPEHNPPRQVTGCEGGGMRHHR